MPSRTQEGGFALSKYDKTTGEIKAQGDGFLLTPASTMMAMKASEQVLQITLPTRIWTFAWGHENILR